MSNTLASFSDQLASTVEHAGKSVVSVHARSRFDSSGVHWAPGIVVTAEHAIRQEEHIRISSAQGEFDAELAGRDPGTDLAVLRVPGLAIPIAERADDSALKPGGLILTVGRMKGSVSAALGVVGSVSAGAQTWRGGRLDQIVRLDIALHPAASGGAVVGVSGKLTGIATGALSRVSVFAIPLATIARVSDKLIAHGRIPRGYIGVGLQPVELPEHLKNQTGIADAKGLLLVSVDPSAPAGVAGMMIGDILIELGGKPVRRPEDVQQVLDSDAIGTKLAARVLRGGVPVELTVIAGERPRKA